MYRISIESVFIMMSCPNCGKQVKIGTTYCPYCGYLIDDDAKPSTNKPLMQKWLHNNEVTSKQKMVRWIIGIVILIIVILLGVHLKNQYMTPNIEMSETAVDHPWILKAHENGHKSGDALNMYYHKNGHFEDKLGKHDPNPETGKYRFTKDNMIIRVDGDTFRMRCYKYSHGTYYYEFVKVGGIKVPRKDQKANYLTFTKK